MGLILLLPLLLPLLLAASLQAGKWPGPPGSDQGPWGAQGGAVATRLPPATSNGLGWSRSAGSPSSLTLLSTQSLERGTLLPIGEGAR